LQLTARQEIHSAIEHSESPSLNASVPNVYFT
jgi:hypothetical protein